MKIKRIEPDKDGYITVPNFVTIMAWGLVAGKPGGWCLIDPLVKGLPTAKLIVKRDGDSIDEPLARQYRATLTDEDNEITYHIFEIVSQIAPGGILPPGLMGGKRK